MRTARTCLSTLALLSLAGLMGCSTNNSTAPAMGTMNVRMTDAPGDFQSVNLVVNEVAAHIEGSGAAGEWTVLNSTPATYDLLTLRNGVTTAIGQATIPAGHYTQIRLMLGEGSNVMVDDATHPLIVPSGLQTGVKVVGSFDVPAGGTLNVLLDFDAARSVHRTGAGTYMLVPTVKVLEPTTGGGEEPPPTP